MELTRPLKPVLPSNEYGIFKVTLILLVGSLCTYLFICSFIYFTQFSGDYLAVGPCLLIFFIGMMLVCYIADWKNTNDPKWIQYQKEVKREC